MGEDGVGTAQVRAGEGARLDALEAEVAALREAIGAAGAVLAAGGRGPAGGGAAGEASAGARELPFTNAARKGIRTGFQVAVAAVPGLLVAAFGGRGAAAAPYVALLLTPVVAVGQNAIEDNVLGRAFLRNVTPTGRAKARAEARAASGA